MTGRKTTVLLLVLATSSILALAGTALGSFTGPLRVTNSSIKPRSFHLNGGHTKYCFTLTAAATGYVQVINSKKKIVQRLGNFVGRKTACRSWKGKNLNGRNVSLGRFTIQVKARNAASHGFGGNRIAIVLAPKTSGGGGGSGQTCTPGYSPCLVWHGGADYDCYGGSGNGPYYTAPGVTYHVNDSEDIYGLDANHNGLGCE
jgi:hypothetical protein